MTILETGLRVIVQEHSKDFTESLLARDIDVEKQNWDHAVVAYNAQAGAEFLSIYAKKEGLQYLYAILDGTTREKITSPRWPTSMLHQNAATGLPPYWIIQHAVDEKLLEEYCTCLEEILPTHMAMLPANGKN